MGMAKAVNGAAFVVVVRVRMMLLEGGSVRGLQGVRLAKDALAAATATTREGIHETRLLLLL